MIGQVHPRIVRRLLFAAVGILVIGVLDIGGLAPAGATTPDNTSTTMGSTPNPSLAGHKIHLTATVSDTTTSSTIPTGTVSFFNGSTLIATGNVDGSGNATITDPTFATAGSFSLKAVYNPTGNFATSTSAVVTQVVQGSIATSTVLVTTPNPSLTGQTVHLTATVSQSTNSFAPTGTVSFYDGSTLLDTATLTSGATATSSDSFSTAGTHSLTAVYNPDDAAFLTSTSAAVNQVVAGNIGTTTTLSSSPNPSLIGQSVHLSATVTQGSSGFIPTGSVSFYNGSTLLGTGTLNSGGSATIADPSFGTAGTYSLTAVYNPDTSAFTTSTSSVVSQVVYSSTTRTVLSSTPNPSFAGQHVHLSATITNTAGTSVPTGTVSFYNGSTLISTGTVNSSGVATIADPQFNTVGTYDLKAVYNPNTTVYLTSNSDVVTQTVYTYATTTTMTTSQSPSLVGHHVHLSATVQNSGGPVIPTGTVSFYNGATLISTGPVNANGIATIADPTFGTIGAFSLTAVYNPDSGQFATSTSSAVTQVVDGNLATTTVLTASPNPSLVGRTVHLSASVQTKTTTFVPTGTVSFYNGTALISTGPVDSNGNATIADPTFNSSGTFNLTAVYHPDDPAFLTSTSPVVHQVVQTAPLTITASSGSIPYGATPPAITPSYSGFVAPDTAASLNPGPTCSTTATSSSPVGTYKTSCSGAVDPTYAISYVAGTETVTKAPTSVTAASTTVVKTSSSKSVTFSAVLRSLVTGAPIASQKVVFTLGSGSNKKTCTATTTATGTASCKVTYNLLQIFVVVPPTYSAAFAGTTNYQASTGTGAVN